MTKNIFLIRHGLATHNIDKNKRGEIAYIDPKHRDSNLVEEGIRQAEELNSEILLMNFDLVLVSPLTRTIQTCLSATKNVNKKIISLEYLREFPCTVHTPNNRKSKTILQQKYKNIDFSELLSDEDIFWNDREEETLEELDIRIEKFKNWLKNREEKNIIVFGHASFISRFLGNKEYKHIKHCFSYLVKIV
jgi:broad specificity phosphatase PhoE